MWENQRRQQGEITIDNNNYEEANFTYDLDECYSRRHSMYLCPHHNCNKQYRKMEDLSKHVSSPAHEGNKYSCKDCNKKFSTLTGLNQHLNSTGHSDRENHLVHTLINDSQQQQMLMLTDGRSRLSAEATLYFDGSCKPNPGYGGAGWVLNDNMRGFREITRGSESVTGNNGRHIKVTSNQAEYYGLIHGLRSAISYGIKRLEVKGDSELVIRQMEGIYNVTSKNLIQLHELAKDLIKEFQSVSFESIPRSQNEIADSLAKGAI